MACCLRVTLIGNHYNRSSLTMKKKHLLGLLMAASTGWLGQAADVREGLVSFYPLDTVSEDQFTTPDVVTGNHMILNLMDASNLVDGKRGKAMNFDGVSQYLSHDNAGGSTGLPISQNAKFSVLFWVKAVGTGQNDRRVFSEGSALTTDPLFNIGTHNAGTDGTVDIFIRNSGTRVNHFHSPGTAYDGTWRHVAFVESDGAVTIYIDGVQNATLTYTKGPTAISITSIGAILRATAGAWFAGQVDEVGLWERALTAAEVADVMNNGIATPVPAFLPAITSNPTGAPNLLVGDTITLRGGASGTRPLSYQWQKNGEDLPNETNPTLVLTGIQKSQSGKYRLVVKNAAGSTPSAEAQVTVNDPAPPNVVSGIVSYWPLDEIQGTKTPDIASGYDMELQNLTAADLVAGKFGKAFTFEFARQTLLRRTHLAGDGLPIYNNREFTVSMWVNGAPFQTDLRIFSEGSTANANPLFNIGTHNTAASGVLDSYIRNNTGGTANHIYSTAEPFDNTWHHVAYVQRDVGGVLQASFYIDGVKDPAVLVPQTPLTLNTTTIGGVLRASPSHWFNGMIDDVALWKRALTAEEVSILSTTGTPIPPTNLGPLAVRSFRAEFPRVVKGDSVVLSWDVSKHATVVEIDGGVGDVTSRTVVGLGSVTLPVTEAKTYKITIRRGEETVSATASVSPIEGVATGWSLIDNFDTHAPGPLSDIAWWRDLRGSGSTIVDQGGNKLLYVSAGDAVATLELGTQTLREGQQRTLFARFLTPADVETTNIRHVFGLTEKSLRGVGDTANNIGPGVYPSNETGLLQLGARYAVGGVVDFPGIYLLEPSTLYNVWLDIKNDPIATGDIYSVHISKDGETTRTTIFQDYYSDRDPAGTIDLGPTLPDLFRLYVATSSATAFWFDDFYISKTAFNATVPRVFGNSAAAQPPMLAISSAGGQIRVTWDGGVLEAAPAATGPWSEVAGATSPRDVSATEAARFYRARR